jgi:nucleoside-diphosphate-sugar epimerase
MNLLITGITGFVGGALLVRARSEKQIQIRGAVRRTHPNLISGVEYVQVGDLESTTNWSGAVQGIDVVVHTAARVHVMTDLVADPLTEYRHVNVEGTLSLARQAADAGVKRFVFISSIKVNGEETHPANPYTADDRPTPTDPYGISKYEAEQGLQKLAEETGMEVVIIRPVLVYGPGVKANFFSMMSWLRRGILLPLGAINNRRSFVAIDNLVDLIVTCLSHPAAANQTFLVSDGEDLSTTELLQRTAKALGRKGKLIPVPVGVLKSGACLLGKKDQAQRLFGSLQIDMKKTRDKLGWVPSVSIDVAIKKTAEHFLKNL